MGLAVAVKVELEIGNAQRECVPTHIGVEKSSKSEKSRKKRQDNFIFLYFA